MPLQDTYSEALTAQLWLTRIKAKSKFGKAKISSDEMRLQDGLRWVKQPS